MSMTASVRSKVIEGIVTKLGVPENDVLRVIEWASTGLAPRGLAATLRNVTTLLPPWLQTKTDVEGLRRGIPVASERARWTDERRAALAELVEQRGDVPDELALRVWPVRSLSDLGIRRTRLGETWAASLRIEGRVPAAEAALLPGFDLIAAVNLLNARILLGAEWWETWRRLGAFDGDLEHYIAVAKHVNNALKRADAPGLDPRLYCEAAGLTGYRQEPFEGFDRVEETKRLAHGGQDEHGLPGTEALDAFRRVAESVLVVPVTEVEFKTFEQFVEEGSWLTPGSSSLGVKLDWTADGEPGKPFKVRKNLIPFVYDPVELAAEARAWRGQVNTTVVKSELGKLRIAVAGDTLTYLQMSYVMYLLNGAYLAWPSSTIEEDVAQQEQRLAGMIRALAKAWGLPFDYAEFDHQPTLAELLVILEILLALARVNVPEGRRGEVEQIFENIKAGMAAAKVRVRTDKGEWEEFEVTGGVMSGLRFTTMFGNAWNTVMLAWACHCLQALGLPAPLRVDLRGDDSAIVSARYAELLVYRWCLAAVGAVGNESKFGLLYQGSEFLRVMLRQEGAAGYVLRALPGIQQRKPWSAQPWDPVGVLKAVREALGTLARRGVCLNRVRAFWDTVATAWCTRKHVDRRWLQLPASWGGFGVEAWRGIWRSTGHVEKPNKGLGVPKIAPWALTRVKQRFDRVAELTPEQVHALAEMQAVESMATDDVPAVSAALHKSYRMPKGDWYRFEWRLHAVEELQRVCGELAALPARAGEGERWRAANPCDAGSGGRWAYVWALCVEAAAVTDETATARMRRLDPQFGWDLAKVQRRGLTRPEALGWLLGDIELPPMERAHPALGELRRAAMMRILSAEMSVRKMRPGELTALCAALAPYVETKMVESAYALWLYMW
jgi:hypothetical protein